VAAVSVSGPDGATATVGQVVAAFQAAGATAAWLPAAPAIGPPIAVADYNLATWDGKTTAYLSCNLDLRGPEYLGTCIDMPVTCAAQTNDTAPYSCMRAADNSTVPGSIRNSTYRCEQASVMVQRQRIACAAHHLCLAALCTAAVLAEYWMRPTKLFATNILTRLTALLAFYVVTGSWQV
jgi:hypothetical protein